MEERREDPVERATLNIVKALEISRELEGEDMMPVLLAIADLVKILHARKSHYTWAEKVQIINQLSYLNNSQENLPDDFYKKLWAFFEGMNVFTEKLSKTSDIHYFKDLSEWVKMILDNFVSLEDRDQAELGEFSEYGREHSDSSVAITFYEEMYRSSKLDALNRLCNGIEIYVLLKKLHQLSDKEINPEEIKALYKSLMMALHKAGKLTDPLRRELNREAQAGEFDSLGHIYEIFRGMLKEDKSDLLLDYLPKKESLGPTESFVRVLERNTAPQAIGNMQFAYQQLMAEMRLETLKRAGAAIGLFVALSNLEKVKTESRSTDEHYSDAKLKEDRSSQIETVYSELILALKVAGLLTDKLDKTLVVEMSACLDAVKLNPRAELELKSLAQCHADLKRMLRKDTVCILADYVPRDKDLYLSNESFDPQKPFYQFLVEDYFNKVNVGQATVLNQSALELDKYYRQKLAEGLEADYGDLLGDGNRLTSEALDKVLVNFGPVRKLEILEEIFKAIDANNDEMYKPKRRLIRADRKKEYTDLQRKHVQCLQETYLDILRNNKDPLMESCIGPSKLLAFKDAGLVGLKAQARQIVQQQNLSGMSKK